MTLVCCSTPRRIPGRKIRAEGQSAARAGEDASTAGSPNFTRSPQKKKLLIRPQRGCSPGMRSQRALLWPRMPLDSLRRIIGARRDREPDVEPGRSGTEDDGAPNQPIPAGPPDSPATQNKGCPLAAPTNPYRGPITRLMSPRPCRPGVRKDRI